MISFSGQLFIDTDSYLAGVAMGSPCSSPSFPDSIALEKPSR